MVKCDKQQCTLIEHRIGALEEGVREIGAYVKNIDHEVAALKTSHAVLVGKLSASWRVAIAVMGVFSAAGGAIAGYITGLL